MYTWEAENRLVAVAPAPDVTLAEGMQWPSYVYDDVGRRVWKQLETYQGGSWTVTEQPKFLWDDWKLLLELEDIRG